MQSLAISQRSAVHLVLSTHLILYEDYQSPF